MIADNLYQQRVARNHPLTNQRGAEAGDDNGQIEAVTVGVNGCLGLIGLVGEMRVSVAMVVVPGSVGGPKSMMFAVPHRRRSGGGHAARLRA